MPSNTRVGRQVTRRLQTRRSCPHLSPNWEDPVAIPTRYRWQIKREKTENTALKTKDICYYTVIITEIHGNT